jgi:hypothetical protein
MEKTIIRRKKARREVLRVGKRRTGMKMIRLRKRKRERKVVIMEKKK